MRGGENGGGQHVMYSVLLGNKSSTSCTLAGYPRFTLLDAVGRVIHVLDRRGPNTTPVVLVPGIGPPRAHLGRKGQAAFTFVNVSRGLCDYPAPPAHATIGIPGDPATIPFDMALQLPEVCSGQITVGSFVPLD